MFRWTLSRELGLFLLVQVAVLVFVYSQLLPQYLWGGIQQAAQVFTETEARRAAEVLEATGALPASDGRSIELYLGMEAVPARLRTLYPDDEALEAGRLYPRETADTGVMLYVHELADGRRVISVFEATREVLSRPGGVIDKTMELIRLRERVGLGFVLLWGVLTAVVLRRIYVRTRRMSQWTQSLTEAGDAEVEPHFGYGEFDDVGLELKGAFDRVASALKRESEFVRNASHELRTPISIIQSNLDLEAKRQGGESEAMSRIRRAIHRMQGLTETLLWLSRETRGVQATELLDLTLLTRQVVEEHQHLLNDKTVVVVSTPERVALELAPSPVRIALANLVRNAFQHGALGEVSIAVSSAGVEVSNEIDSPGSPVPWEPVPVDGLGLTLVRKVCERMGWRLDTGTRDGLHVAELRFKPVLDPS